MMRHIAVHDRHGTIVMLSSGTADGPPPPAPLERRQDVTEVDLGEIGLDPSSFDSEQDAIDAVGALRVDFEHKGRVVRRQNG